MNHTRSLDTVLFYPYMPHRYYTITRVVTHGGWWVTNDLDSFYNVIIHWNNRTFKKPKDPLPDFVEGKRKWKIINYGCTNIGKNFITKTFSDVFEEEFLIDPLKYEGTAVRKSNINAEHDGKLVDCPLKKFPKNEKGGDFSYQKYIDGNERKYFINIRVPVFGDEIPFVYKYFKPKSQLFTGLVEKALIINNPLSYFSTDEYDKLIRFCKTIHLDYGELDLIRDRHTNQIYIVDVNDTPTGPPGILTGIQFDHAMDRLTESFHRLSQNFMIKRGFQKRWLKD